jgi:hypothetical protein
MKLVSIDVGLRNFSWCTLLREPSIEEKWQVPPFRGNSISIVDWNVVDIVELSTSDEINLNETDIATIVPWFCTALESFKARLIVSDLDLAMIEAQPTAHMLGGKSISNIKTKVLSHLLQAFFFRHGIPVKFVSPACKLRDAKSFMTDSSVYAQHKKAAIQLSLVALEIIGGSFQPFFLQQKRKKDDLADSFLQGVCGDVEIKEKKKTRKKKRVNEVLNLPTFD